jgi:hypothetical protein
MNETKKCPNCGLDNQIDRSICDNCYTPLTAYGKQVGMVNDFESKLTKQVEALDERPKVVHVMAAFTALLALPLLARVISGFRHQPTADPENVNAITTAFAAIGPLFYAVIFIPLAIALVVLAYFTWTQQPWTWTANLVVLGLTALLVLLIFHLSLAALFWLAVLGTLTYFWLTPDTKAWYGLM